MTLNSSREHSRVLERDPPGGRLQAANTARGLSSGGRLQAANTARGCLGGREVILNSPREHSRVLERDPPGGRLQAANTARGCLPAVGCKQPTRRGKFFPPTNSVKRSSLCAKLRVTPSRGKLTSPCAVSSHQTRRCPDCRTRSKSCRSPENNEIPNSRRMQYRRVPTREHRP